MSHYRSKESKTRPEHSISPCFGLFLYSALSKHSHFDLNNDSFQWQSLGLVLWGATITATMSCYHSSRLISAESVCLLIFFLPRFASTWKRYPERVSEQPWSIGNWQDIIWKEVLKSFISSSWEISSWNVFRRRSSPRLVIQMQMEWENTRC